MAAGAPPLGAAKDPAPAAQPVRWVGALLRRALGRSPRSPRAPRRDAVRRSWLFAFWRARVSVRAGVALDDFLRSRLARYLAALPVPSARLPLSVDVEDGRLLVRPAESPAAPPPPEATPADAVQQWLAPLVAVEGPAVRREATELEIRFSVLDGQIEAARHRSEELSRRFAADVAQGSVAAPPAVEATAEQMGRPPVRSGSPYAALLAFLGATVLAATWQIALPLLRAANVDPSALRPAFEARPVEVAFVVLFALGVAVGLFALADAALVAAERLFRGDDDARRRRFLAGSAAAATAFAVLVSSALAALNRDPGGTPAWVFVVLLLVLPLGSALLLRLARADAARRAADAPAALAWDRERARALVDRGRRLAELEWAAAEERALERQREVARERLRELDARALEAARVQTEAAQREGADLARLAQSLVAALDLDRLEFIRQASARGALELIVPRRRPPPPEPRPVAAPPAESGRLAS